VRIDASSFFVVPVVACVVFSGCASGPNVDHKTPEVECMQNTFASIRQAMNSHSQAKQNISKEQLCSSKVEAEEYFGRQKNSGAYVGRGVAISIVNEINLNKKSSFDLMRDCMSDQTINSYVAPPAYQQFGKVVFALESIDLNFCPADFKDKYESHLQSRRGAFYLAKENSRFTSSDWVNYAYDVKFVNYQTETQTVIGQEMRTLKVPGNALEKRVVDSEKFIISTYQDMQRVYAKNSGMCFSEAKKAVLKC
jgi:hypothetical protein